MTNCTKINTHHISSQRTCIWHSPRVGLLALVVVKMLMTEVHSTITMAGTQFIPVKLFWLLVFWQSTCRLHNKIEKLAMQWTAWLCDRTWHIFGDCMTYLIRYSFGKQSNPMPQCKTCHSRIRIAYTIYSAHSHSGKTWFWVWMTLVCRGSLLRVEESCLKSL